MASYIIRRLLFVIPTLLGIMAVNFILVQSAPGGPIEQIAAKMQNLNANSVGRVTGEATEVIGATSDGAAEQGGYIGARGMDPALIEELRKQFGFDKPPLQRFLLMVKSYILFDFGESFYKGRSVLSLIAEAMPVSVSLGLWSTLIIYFVSVFMGIMKAVYNGSAFDVWSSFLIIIGYAIPSFLFAILLLVLLAGGSFWQVFPLGGLVSENFESLGFWGKIGDYFHHIALPTLTLVIGGFVALTMLTKNSFLEEIHKQYVYTARAKGLTRSRVLLGHVFRNAMLLVIASAPAVLVGIFFTGSLLVEIIFSLNGLGLLGFEAVVNRDYPVIFATLYIFTLLGLILKLVSDFTYTLIDPRIDFEKRGA